MVPESSSADTPTMVPLPSSGGGQTGAGVASGSDAWGAGGLQPGTVLGNRYEILQALGEGGMGAVYKARDRELDRLVALKVIRPDLARNPAIIQRFKQELILARQVTHRNVIRIFDLGEADGIKFITMEFIEGKDLRSLLLEHKKYSPEEAAEIIRQVCLALDCAHSEGVIHRDLKPQNIMQDAQGRIVVMDFGLARSLESDGMTQTGALIGTMEYMSPEQGLGQELDQRSDLFTLGLIFYELLTGQVPYKADSALASLLKRTQERAVPISSLDNTVPRVVNDIVAKCLERDPKLRYGTAKELLTDLEAWQGKSAAASIRLPAVQPWGQDIPWVWISVAAVVIILAVTGFLLRAKLFAPSAKAPTGPVVSLAILPFRNASNDASVNWMGPALAEMLRTDMGESAAMRTVASDRVSQIVQDLRIAPDASLDPDTLRRIADNISADHVLWGQYVKLGDHIRIDASLQDMKNHRNWPLKPVEATGEKDLPRAVRQLAEAVQQGLALPAETIKELQAKTLRPSTESVQALRYYNEGVQLAYQGKNPEAEKSFQEATREDPNFALAYAKLGQMYALLGYGDEAEQATRKAVDLSENLPAAEKYLISAIHFEAINDSRRAIQAYEQVGQLLPEDSNVQFALAGLYNTVGSFDKAREYYNKLLQRDPKYVEALYGLAGVDTSAGNSRAALDDLNRALPVTIDVGNEQQQARILYGLGVTYAQLSKPDEALRNYQNALDIQRRLGQKHDLALTLNGMGQVEDALGRSQEALKSFQEALQLRRELGDKKGIGDTLIDFSNFYEARGQNEQALAMLKESLQIQRDIGNQAYEALCLTNIGINYGDEGKYDDALTYLTQGAELREKLKDPGEIADSNYSIAETLVKLGQYDQALQRYLRALELWRGLNDKRHAAYASYGLGNVFEQQGRLSAALEAKGDALKTMREVQDKIGTAEMLGGYAESLSLLGRSQEAEKSAGEALAMAREVKNQSLVGQNLNIEGDTFFYRGDMTAAAARYRQALQEASKTTDRRLELISKFNLAKVAVVQGRSREAISSLRTLGGDADAAGIKYLSVESSVYLGEALADSKEYAKAQEELNRALARSEKLGLRMLQVKSQYLLATVLRLTGQTSDATRHYADVLRILNAMNNEAKSESFLKRADLAAIYTESSKRGHGPAA